MRLLNVKNLQFEQFFGEARNGIPPYAILSHTWGAEEVTYNDHVEGRGPEKSGFDKIRGCARLADAEGFRYIWIDTCCIDKSSSVELSEAINSMFQWYRDAAICYAFLSDVPSSEDPAQDGSSFARSRWFTRAWTLQELLAPAEVIFVGSDWREIGTKKSLGQLVSRITCVSEQALEERRWPEYSVAQKMSWAVGRQATRPEDEAYCLMGLFDVNMPMLYGEGRKAFARLQEEILKQSNDQSIFAWSYPEDKQSHTQFSGLFAPSPDCFRHVSRVDILPFGRGEEYENPFQLVHHLVRINMKVIDKVQGLGVQQTQEGPVKFHVAEVDQDGRRQRFTSPRGALRENLKRQRQESPVDEDETEVKRSKRPSLCIPEITIEVEEATEEAPFDPLSKSPINYRRRRMSDSNFFDGPRRSEGTDIDISDDGNTRNSPPPPPSPEQWRWYIYEPVIVVPLRCHVNGKRLAILLSRGITRARDGLLARLHNPSLVTINTPSESQLSSITSYVHMSAPLAPEVHRWRNTRWPEIKFASVISTGFAPQSNWGPNWDLDASGTALIPRGYTYGQQGIDAPEYAPLVMFYRIPADNTTPTVFVVSIPIFEVSELVCEVCVLSDTTQRSLGEMEYDLYTYNLASLRQAKVPLGNGEFLVLRYRQGSGVSYVVLSVEELPDQANAVRTGLVSRDMTKTAWLNQRLFPMLRSLKRSLAEASKLESELEPTKLDE
ncbi:vegetative incompatibility protein HET-E-1 [Cladorrhinum samala]|uniref:Vegetative incompatibility protein HET-E-1 n=1 Tax=Cladorrhinum samala TaxID=585594 RepID=A0AAV9HQT5_9PEZI|nr:vegetative incompatibility protein HET-E-1 [Cladorrhinum samala]